MATAVTLDARWPRWTWVVLPALAIAIGGSAGYIVGGREPDRAPQAVHQARPQITPIPMPAQPDPNIEVEPDPDPGKPVVHGATRPAANKPKPHKAKPLKSAPCNVYDHMDGC